MNFAEDYVSALRNMAKKKGETVEKLYKEQLTIFEKCVKECSLYNFKEKENVANAILYDTRILRNTAIIATVEYMKETNSYTYAFSFNFTPIRYTERSLYVSNLADYIAKTNTILHSEEIRKKIRESH